MLPYAENIPNVLDLTENEREKTRTFALNILENTIGGEIDDVAALHQAIYLMLNIEADQYIIYPYTYGFQRIDLIGKPIYYVIAILPDRVKETLTRDDRILDVSDFEFEVDKHQLHVKFKVSTIYGVIQEETVVMY